MKNSGLLTVHNQGIFIIFQWFEHCEILDAETTANICKFRGDHKYYNKQYEEALLCYRQALGWFHQFNEANLLFIYKKIEIDSIKQRITLFSSD